MTLLAIKPAEQAVAARAATPLTLPDILFYLLAALTVAGAAGVALSRNILYSAIGLLMALLGAGSLYIFLGADFLAVTQLLVYIGGVLVLIMFAVMLTNRITEITVSNSSVGLFGGVMLFLATAPVLVAVAVLTPFAAQVPGPMEHTTAAIGDGFLTRWLLPFEVASLVLLATLVGAVVIARKEIKAD
ncbi:MAG: NADH-quinone oxidoreductase subunit J [Anaeromyxobacter sp.]|nr:NADH-quinone oxidoreductase subunit J [Anaeromyxobacter sp.]MBL0276820.1 NADH-quinone oxidoreductase subunit J [Anaeromyxobacter sp.]